MRLSHSKINKLNKIKFVKTFGETVIVLGNGHDDQNTDPGRGCLRFTSKCPRERHESSR